MHCTAQTGVHSLTIIQTKSWRHNDQHQSQPGSHDWVSVARALYIICRESQPVAHALPQTFLSLEHVQMSARKTAVNNVCGGARDNGDVMKGYKTIPHSFTAQPSGGGEAEVSGP